MRDVSFDSKGMTNDCPLVADRSFGDCTNCHHFLVYDGKFRVVCNFPGDRGKLRTWFFRLNQWVDEDGVAYGVLEMHLPTPGAVVHLQTGETGFAFSARYVEDAITRGKDIAKQHHCKFLDIDCPKGSGGRKVIILK